MCILSIYLMKFYFSISLLFAYLSHSETTYHEGIINNLDEFRAARKSNLNFPPTLNYLRVMDSFVPTAQVKVQEMSRTIQRIRAFHREKGHSDIFLESFPNRIAWNYNSGRAFPASARKNQYLLVCIPNIHACWQITLFISERCWLQR